MPEPGRSLPLYRGRWLRVDGEEWPGVGYWEIVRPLDAACVLALTPSGEALLVRQFRVAARRSFLEIPAGLLDVDGEEASACAARELREETGYEPESIEPLASVHSSPGYSTERIHIFLARTSEDPLAEPEEGIELVRRPFSELVAEARAGELEDAKTALAVLLADARQGAG
jgi:ADP-ribose pyrophosphatase